jgi:hypothetical protein
VYGLPCNMAGCLNFMRKIIWSATPARLGSGGGEGGEVIPQEKEKLKNSSVVMP